MEQEQNTKETLRIPKRLWLVLLVLPGLALLWLSRRDPLFTEKWLSQGLYPIVMTAISAVSGLFPYALVEMFLIMGAGVGLWYLVHSVRVVLKEHSRWKQQLLEVFSTAAALVSALFFLFCLTCGYNYHRLTFAEHSGLTVRPSSVQELADLYEELIGWANEVRPLVESDENGIMTLREKNLYTLSRDAQQVFRELGEEYPILSGHYAQPKPIFFSELMSCSRFLGNFSSYTGEPCINVNAPDYNIPMTMCHEQAHQQGFMREDEANFIAYLACTHSSDPDFVYSGLAQSLNYVGNALYAADRDLYFSLREQYSPQVSGDIRSDAEYWSHYEGKIAQAADAWNDAYLKANDQTDGVQSYGRVVDLMLADYRQRHGLQ